MLFNFLYSLFGVNAKIGDLGNRIFKDLRIQVKSSFLSTSTFINSKKLSSKVRFLPLTETIISLSIDRKHLLKVGVNLLLIINWKSKSFFQSKILACTNSWFVLIGSK